MKSKWLKKAMAAFLAVLMTVCALPVAAFVPETVETGEEFEPSISATSGVSNGGKSVDYGDLTYTINANGEVECVNYFNNSKRLTNIKNAELLCVIDDFLLVLRTQNSITEIMTYSISEEKEIDVYQIENKIEAISTRGKCIYYLSDHSIFEYDILTQTKNCIYRNSEMTSFVLSDFYTIAVYIDSDLSKLSSQEYILISIENNEDVSKTKLQAEDSSYSVSIGGNIIPFSDYPNGSYFTDNGQPCAVGAHKEENTQCYMSESYCNCKCTYNGVWLKSSQCMGFASMTFLRLYGHTIYDQCYKSVPTIAIGSVTKNRVQSLISDGSIKPGAHIRTINGHSLIYMGSDSQYFYTYEGNTDNRCRVSVIRNTWDSAIGYYNKNGISYVQLPNNYPDTGTLPDPTATTTSSSTGHKYAVYNYATTWENAKAKCEELGGYLATITSDSEQSLVLSLVQNLNKPCWIGAYRDSGSSAYKWITGESFSYTNWDDDEPSMSNGGRDERFVGIYANDTDTQYSTTGKWNDFSETTGTIKGFVCEWNPQTYTVSYNANGGTGAPGNQTKTHDQSLTLSNVQPTKDGYTFQGWSTTLNGSVQYNPGSAYSGNANLTLYAVWSESSYSVWLDPNGGSIQTFSVTVTHNSLYGALPEPVRVDYTFTGWYTAKEGGTRVTSETVVSSTVSHTLYDHWNRQKWIVMHPNGGDGETEWTCLEYPGEFVDIPTSCYTRAGYKMIGWSTSKTATVPEYGLDKEYIVITYDENGDIKLYAVWEAIPVTSVTLNQTTASLKKGETLTLTATVAPSDAANKSVTWSSGNTSVATVSTSGVVTAVGEGTAVITVTTADGGKTATCTVAVAHTHNYTGTYYETAHPHKAYSTCSCGKINYTGATQKVASCASCYPVTGVTLDKTTASLKKGETLALAVTVSPSDAANKAFTVTSSNPSVMSAKYRIGICVGDLFDGSTCTASHCEFTALSAGSTTLTFTTEDGQKTASCTVTVTEPVVNAKAKFTLSEASGRPGDTVKITLSLKTEETINSIAISGITYDTSIMTFTGFSDYEHIEDLTILPPTFDEEKMAIVIGLKNAAAFDGDICTLNFKINENALEGVTNIDASSVVKLKSVEIPSAVASGKVNVRLQTLGDIDGNDTVDIDDAVLLFQYSMLPELYPISYAGNLDFNKDGTVDIDDAVRLFQYSMLPDLYPLE